MPVCSVITCKYSQADEYNVAAEGIVFHPFPRNEETRSKWVEMTGLDDWTPTSKDYICSRHFRDNDYFIKRSGKRYLKTAAIPCEYVVYRHLFPDEPEPKVVEVDEEEQENHMQQENQPGTRFDKVQWAASDPPRSNYGLQFAGPENPAPCVVEPIPGPSRGFSPGTLRQHASAQVPDSTSISIATIYDDENVRDWDRIRPERYFGLRPPTFLFDDTSQEVVDSSGFGFDEHSYGRDEEASRNPYPPDELDLRPHLQQLPLPRTPEPIELDEPENTLDAERGPGIEGLMDIPVSSAIAEIMRGQQKLQDIRQIMTRRKSSKKANAAARAEVVEAEKAKFELQTREMNDHEKATAIITLQTKNIIKLKMKHRKLKKILKRISAVLRRVNVTIY